MFGRSKPAEPCPECARRAALEAPDRPRPALTWNRGETLVELEAGHARLNVRLDPARALSMSREEASDVVRFLREALSQ